MSNLEKYLKMLQSKNSSVRYDGCEELRVATESSPEVIHALEKAQNDEDAVVAERARAALDAEVHQQMALKMGKIGLLKQQESKTKESKTKESETQEPLTFEPVIGAVSGAITLMLILSRFWRDLDSIACYGVTGGLCGAVGAIIAKQVIRKWLPGITDPRITSILGGILGGGAPLLCLCIFAYLILFPH